MNVTRDVILDLLPLVLAGEASPDTRTLVADYLERDPELAREVRERGPDELGRAAPLTLPPEAELEALRRTRGRVAQLRWLFGSAMAFTALSLGVAVTFSGGHVSGVRLLLFEYPQLMSPLLAIGLVLWVAYFVLRRRLRHSAP